MIRFFVGCAPNNEDLESQSVLEWSIRKHATEPVEINWMQLGAEQRYSGWRTERWATPFSGFRWGIPHFCGFEGRAIYCDSDVIFMADPAQLFHQKFAPGKYVMAKGHGSWRFCVSLWDCAGLKNIHYPSFAELREDPFSHSQMSKRFKNAPFVQPFEGSWNCLDGEDLPLDDPRLKAIHYTAMSNQPQLKYALPRLAAAGQKHWFDGKVEPHWRKDIIKLFDDLLEEAKANGYHPEKYVKVPFGDFKKASMKNYKTGRRGW